MELEFKSDTRQRKFRFIGKSFAHPAKMSLPLQIWLIERYSKPGDWILDPMAGSGTLLVACSLSRNVILVELEEKFIKICEENWEKVKMVGAEMGHTIGRAVILQGDARNLLEVLYDDPIGLPDVAFETQDVIITSPPYAEAHNTKDLGVGDKDRADLRPYSYLKESEDNLSNLPYGSPDVIITSPPYSESVGKRAGGKMSWGSKDDMPYLTKYSDSDNNLGNLPHGDIDAIITSPPYEQAISGSAESKESSGFQSEEAKKLCQYAAEYSASPDNLGNLKGQTYLGEMKRVYEQCYKVLKPGGLLVLVVKNFIRNKAIMPLDEHTIQLCESVGFKLIERHYRKLLSQSFWRVIYKQRYPTAPTIDVEHILVFRVDKR